MDLTAGFGRAVCAVLGLPPDGALPSIDRLALYRAEVKAASSDGKTVDVQPEDDRIEPHQNVPVRVGIPGAVAVVQPGAIVLIGWERGDSSRIYAVPSWEVGATVTKLVLNGTEVYVGAESGAEPAAMADKLLQRIQDIEAKFDAHVQTLTGTAGPFPIVGTATPPASPTAHAPPFAAQKAKVA